MQKKFIFTLLVSSLVFGLAGGAGFSWWFFNQWMAQNEAVEEAVETVVFSEDGMAMVEAQQTVAPAVVSLVEYVSMQELHQQYFGGQPFGFQDFSYYDPDQDGRTELGGGTGFIIDPSGIVLTNKHVVSTQSGEYVAILNDGTEFNVTIEAIDPGNDIAILQLVAEPGSDAEALLGSLPYVELGDSDALLVGQPVLAIGNALAEYENTTTAGIISATGRKIVASDSYGNSESLYGLLQTDAAINPGNSGGPLIDLSGKVIGINTAVDTEAQGIGFAIPIDDVKPAIESWQTYGKIIRPMLGVRYVMLTAPRAKELGFDVTHGALVVGNPNTNEPALVEGGPADLAGIEEGDIILSVDGEAITLEYTLQDAVIRHQVGEVLIFEVWRDGETFEVEVELTALPSSD